MNEIRQKAAQIIFPRLGSNMPPRFGWKKILIDFAGYTKNTSLADSCLFNGHYKRTPEMLAALQRISKAYPLLVSSDIERGSRAAN